MEGILVNLKSTDGGSSTATLVMSALKSKKIFVFGEILSLPQVQKLKDNPPLLPTFKALELFAYGTYSDYIAQQAFLPELPEQSLWKLKQLTCVTLASQNKQVEYSKVMMECGIDNIRLCEDLIISCVYEGLIRARLDQKNQKFIVQWSSARDVQPEKIDFMIKKLGSWCDSADSIMKRIDLALDNASKQREQEIAEHNWVQDAAEQMKQQVMRESSDSTIGRIDDSITSAGSGKGRRSGGGGATSSSSGGGMMSFLGRRS
jgi:COP9 signalosome complex subunit 7